MNSTTLRLTAVPLGVAIVGAAAYVIFSAPPGFKLNDNELGVLTCNEYLGREVRDQIRDDGRTMKARKRYAHVSRVVACASPDGGQCDEDTDALVLIAKADKREIVGTGRCTLEPCDERCDAPRKLRIAASPCVIPRCENDAGEYDESVGPVDCQRRSRNIEGVMETRWFGCNVFPASEAVGSACEPASCEVWSGSSGAEL